MHRGLIFSAVLFFLIGCGSGGDNGGDDTGIDTIEEHPPDTPIDQEVDLPADTGEEEIPVTPLKQCVVPCTSETDCCFTSSCGSYPDRWTCSGICELAGCLDDPECVSWATARGLPNPDGYNCRSDGDGIPRCVAGCVTEADCCPTGVDCSSYPNRYVCDAGNCFLGGCVDDGECRAFAARLSLYMPDQYVCRQFLVEGLDLCVLSCAVEADCCPPEHAPCDTLPRHYSCHEGLCNATCSTDVECRQYAASMGYPLADRYVCREL